jgi:hypothetical protein
MEKNSKNLWDRILNFLIWMIDYYFLNILSKYFSMSRRSTYDDTEELELKQLFDQAGIVLKRI